jgi:uncharacterized protein (TIGR03435 family)
VTAVVTLLVAPIGAGMVRGGLVDTAQAVGDQKDAGRFEVASIRPCEPAAAAPRRGGRGGSAPTAGEPASATTSPGRLYLRCITAERLIQLAYLGPGRNPPMAGGPEWITTAHFDIEAAAPAGASQATIRGPMLRNLLEDRFQLKTHREIRTRPIYALRPARSGFTLTALPEGTCDPIPGVPPGKARCGTARLSYELTERRIDANGHTMAAFAKLLENDLALERPVIDNTSIAGVFDFHVRFGTDGPRDQVLAAALRSQIGLTLDATTGPVEFLIIDRVEKPAGPGDHAALVERRRK